jgi:shikimate dehydrogenase
VHGAGNVTIPHKRAVAALCDRLTPAAQHTSAVNTFWHEGEELVGDNTDVVGFQRLVDSLGLAQHPRHLALLGAGGGAAAVCEAARAWDGARVRLWSRSAARAEALTGRYALLVEAVATPLDAVRGADLVVNATPVGLTDDAMPLPIEAIPHDAAVTDLVYRLGESRWIREARAHGHPAADGLVMLVEQGAESFHRWFGIEPDRDVMWRALREAPR